MQYFCLSFPPSLMILLFIHVVMGISISFPVSHGMNTLLPLWISGLFSGFFFFFVFFRAAPSAYGGSHARGPIRTVAAGLHHSHSHTRSEPWLWPIYHSSQHCRILNPLSEARDRTHVLMNISQIRVCWAATGTPYFQFLPLGVSLFPCLHCVSLFEIIVFVYLVVFASALLRS